MEPKPKLLLPQRLLLADLPMPWQDDAWEHRPSWRPAHGSNPWLPHPPGYLTPAPTHTDYRLVLPKYVVRTFMQARSDAQRAKAVKLLRQIIADICPRKGASGVDKLGCYATARVS